ncbi:MAG: hypothetical protein ACFFDB_18825 [Promethearchaeota archaeon]
MVNHYLRQDAQVINVFMEIILDNAKDLILPIDFKIFDHNMKSFKNTRKYLGEFKQNVKYQANYNR